jgi:hypothetical protein
MSTGRLILAPSDPLAPAPAGESLVAALRAIGLAGAELDPARQTFQAGERFLELISFLGCSPHVDFEPPAPGSEAFCHIALIGPSEAPVLLHGVNTAPPRCPGCGARVTDWRERLSGAHEGLCCEHCGRSLTAAQLKWRRSGGFARLAVEVRNVFPNEAVPVPELMQCLARETGGEWTYFYVQPAD